METVIDQDEITADPPSQQLFRESCEDEISSAGLNIIRFLSRIPVAISPPLLTLHNRGRCYIMTLS